jgi:hypothetical protein
MVPQRYLLSEKHKNKLINIVEFCLRLHRFNLLFRILLIMNLVNIPYVIFGQRKTPSCDDNFIYKQLQTKPGLFGEVLKNPEKYKLQIILTLVDRDDKNQPHFTTYKFRCNPKEYFYPASTIKMPLSALTLEKLNHYFQKGITKDTRLSIEKSYSCQYAADSDKSSHTGFPTIANYIKKALIVSDNVSCNRMYEFLGQSYINKRLKQIGIKKARIVHRFSYCNEKENRHTNAFCFYNSDGKVIYRQPPAFNKKRYRNPVRNMKIGKGYIDHSGRLVGKSMDFSHKNYISLEGLTEILKRIVFPENFAAKKHFDLKPEDRYFLLKQLSSFPCECDIDELKDSAKYFSSMTNYLYYGHDRNCTPDSNIRIFNIAGQAYGFLTDCAYIVDFSKNIEFFLSATIYTNEDQILNDDKYEYETTGFPFLKNLGLFFYDFECQREKSIIPDLSSLKEIFIN